ncbi:hypothetical protein [Paenibacillus harenae]|uniref:hypothetical protein n=1 Tax=Paenibacillus harenae TaxID=306543 RepID=UPI002794F1B3|nr:hypothetical protein [Paenibacillus harenae]MDQ0058197.1 hypothetical protein [Paenibacillus harenae]
MRISKPLLTACLATIALTLLFSALPHQIWKSNNGREEVAVFRPAPVVRLSNQNLVDVLISAQLSERIKKADWHNAILSIDLKVDTEEGRPTAWFADVERLLRVSFLQLENVRRVLVRIVEDREEQPRLLAAVDVRKTDDWLDAELDLLRHADPVHDELWRNRLRVSFTAAWEERFGRVSSYSAERAKEAAN